MPSSVTQMLVNTTSFCHTHPMSTVTTGVSLIAFILVAFQVHEFWPLECSAGTGWYIMVQRCKGKQVRVEAKQSPELHLPSAVTCDSFTPSVP